MKLIRPFDFVIGALIIIFAIMALVVFQGTEGGRAEVYVNKRKAAVFSLSGPERSKEIQTRIGKMQLLVGQGSIRVLTSHCSQKICILQGAIQYTHESIICLPSQVYIKIVKSNDSENPYQRIDAISY